MEIETKIQNFILETFLFTDDKSALNNEDSFLEKGIIDSTGILELIFFIEEEFGVAVGAEEMIPENLDSVMNAVKFVESKI